MFLSRLATFPKLVNVFRIYQKCFSQKIINLSEPSVQKYFDYLLLENENLLLKENRSFNEVRRLRELEALVSVLTQRMFLLKNIESLKEIRKSEEDSELRKMIQEEYQIYLKRSKEIDNQLQSVLVEPFLSDNSILLEIVADEGDEGPLFAKELFDMYKSYSKYKNWIVDVASVEEAETGLRKASLIIEGKGALELMNMENGVHHRISKEDQLNRISTAIVTTLLVPNITEINVPISELQRETKNIEIADNLTDAHNYVSLTHIPTGTFVKCKEYKSNIVNEFVAKKELNTLLFHNHKTSKKIGKNNVSSSDKIIRTYDCSRDRVMEHRESDDGQHRLSIFMKGGELLERLHESLLSYQKYQSLMKDISKFENKNSRVSKRKKRSS